MNPKEQTSSTLNCTGLFAGIGGFELGFRKAGIRTNLLCEIDVSAQKILSKNFPDSPLVGDIRSLKSLPKSDIITAGFPCQNLSLVGDNKGIFGQKSGLIQEVFRLIRRPSEKFSWLVLENVPFMLWQKGGQAIGHITTELSNLGFFWAYRVIDSRAFGIPQRRRRVVIVASRIEDPRTILFGEDAGDLIINDDGKVPCGFYWTEGRAGLGWAINGLPTLKGGSSIGIPSAPAIWNRSNNFFGTPDVRDGERLQGFTANHTAIELDGKAIREGQRWKLVGNAVSVPLSTWLGSQFYKPKPFNDELTDRNWEKHTWPNAAWGYGGKAFAVKISEYPVIKRYTGLTDFLKYPQKKLSEKAARGFLRRASSGRLNFAEGFLRAVNDHIEQVKDL